MKILFLFMNLKPRADFDKHKENFLWYSFTENKMILSSFQIRCMYKRYSMSRFIYLETIPLCTNITALKRYLSFSFYLRKWLQGKEIEVKSRMCIVKCYCLFAYGRPLYVELCTFLQMKLDYHCIIVLAQVKKLFNSSGEVICV